jgi:hypothetical protein
MPHVARSRRSRCDAEKRIDGEQIGEGDHQHRDDDDQAPDEGLADVLVGARTSRSCVAARISGNAAFGKPFR